MKLQRLILLSECIYNLTKKIEENHEQSFKYEDLLNDLYLEEENYLDSINDLEYKNLLLEFQKNYNVTFDETVFELDTKGFLSLPILRVYEILKELKDQKSITSLTKREMESLFDNELVIKIKRAIKDIKLLDLSIINSLQEKSKFIYLFSSMETPYQFLVSNLLLDSSKYIAFSYSLDMIKPYLFSLVRNILTEKNKCQRQKYYHYLDMYFRQIPLEYHDELILYFRSEYTKIKTLVCHKNLEQLNKFLFKRGLSAIKEDCDFPLQACELKKFKADEIIKFDSLVKKMYSIYESELKIFMDIKENKLGRNIFCYRNVAYKKLAKLNQEVEKLLKQVDNPTKLLNYLDFIKEQYTTQFDKIDYKNSNLFFFDFPNRLPIGLFEQAKKLNENANVDVNKRHIIYDKICGSISSLNHVNVSDRYSLKWLLENCDEEKTEENIFYNIEGVLYQFLKESALNFFDENYYTMMYLILFQNPYCLETLIKNDFEIDYPFKKIIQLKDNYEDIYYKLIYHLGKVYAEVIKGNDKELIKLFVYYLEIFELYFKPNDYQNLKYEYLRNLQRRNKFNN